MMTRQDYYNIIIKVFKCDEVTEYKSRFTLNKWSRNKNTIDLPFGICYILCGTNVLEVDSGNYGTGETHYILNKNVLSEILSMDLFKSIINEDFVESIIPIYRDIILNEVLND